MLTALDINTNKATDIKPIAINQGAWDVLYLADANTGKGIWWANGQWNIDIEDGDLEHDADRVEDVYGADEE
ncbi:hypothetical protein, partial [Bifidobacterium moukalabense]